MFFRRGEFFTLRLTFAGLVAFFNFSNLAGQLTNHDWLLILCDKQKALHPPLTNNLNEFG